MSRIVFWSPAYAPELIGIPPLVTEAAEGLAGRGHHVDVIAPMPNNPYRRIYAEYRGALWRRETWNGVEVRRSWLRVRPRESFVDKTLWELSYAATSLPLALRVLPRVDTLVCVIPPLLSATTGALLARLAGRMRLVLWVQDLVVRAADSVGGPRIARRALALAEHAERFALRAADAVVVCSPGFVDYVAARGAVPERVHVILNWVDTQRITPGPRSANGRTRFLYAGNLGYTQGFETLAAALRHVPDDLEIEIVGEGNTVSQVRRLAADDERVTYQPPVAPDRLPELLRSADVQLVLQRRVSSNANLPSKIATYLASGRPIIASIDPEAPAARLLDESGGAILVPPEDPERLANAMVLLRNDADLREALGVSGRAFAVAHLDRACALEKLEQVVAG